VLRAGLAATAAAALAAGCGNHTAARSTTLARAPVRPVCRALARAAADDARALVRAFNGQASPGDLAMYDLREDLAYLQQKRCAPALLGEALASRVPARVLAQLDSLLPASYVSDVHQALACSRGERSAERCAGAAASITLPGTGKPGGTSHPLTP
jgi:hypothetical protein